VVGHLEHLRSQVRTAVQQVGLGIEFDVTGQQDPAGRCGRPEHDRGVVDGGAVLAVDVRRCAVGSQDVEREGRPREAPARGQLEHRRARLRGLPGDPPQGTGRLVRRSQRDPTGRPAPQRAREAAHVVGVQMRDDHERQRVDAEATQAGVRRAVVGTDVDEHRLARHAGGEHEGVALPDVAGDHHPVRGRPAGSDHPGRHQDQRQTDRDRQNDEPGAPEADEHHQHQQRAAEQHGTAHAVGPGQHRSRDRRRTVGHQHQPRDGGSGEPRARRGRRGCEGRDHGGEHAEDGGRGDRWHHQQVRHDRHETQPTAQPGDERGRREAGGRRDREHLGGALRHATLLQCGCPAGSDQDERGRREDRQGEPDVDRERRIDHQQHQHGRRHGRDRRAAATERECQQHDAAHHRGPHHARRRPGEHHEPEDRGPGEHRGEPRIRPEQPEQAEDRTAHDREVRAGDRGEVGEAGGPEVLLDLGRLLAGVADHEPRQQARGVLRQHVGGPPQAVAEGSGRGLPPRRRAHSRRGTAHPQDRDGEVGTLGGEEQAFGRDRLAREEAAPSLCRRQQQHPAAGAPLPRPDRRTLELGLDQHPVGPEVGAVGRAAEGPRVVRQRDAQDRGRSALGRGAQRVLVDVERV
jgi:hypothetical protein